MENSSRKMSVMPKLNKKYRISSSSEQRTTISSKASSADSHRTSVNDQFRVLNPHGSYSINSAMEIMARDSINSAGRLSNISSISKISQSFDTQTIDERHWNWKYLRVSFFVKYPLFF